MKCVIMSKSPRELKIDKISLRLYFTGQSPKSVTAIANLKIICNDYRLDLNVVEFVDVLEQPLRLIRDNIPTTAAPYPGKPAAGAAYPRRFEQLEAGSSRLGNFGACMKGRRSKR